MEEWKKGTCHTFCLEIEFGNSHISHTVRNFWISFLKCERVKKQLMVAYSLLPVSKEVLFYVVHRL
jgi:hypothetical protein